MFALEISRYEPLSSLRRNIYKTLLETASATSLLEHIPVDRTNVEVASKYLRIWVQLATRLLKFENETLKKQRVDDDSAILVQVRILPHGILKH